MKDYKTFRQYVEPMIIAIVPTAILYFTDDTWKSYEKLRERILVIVVAYILTALIVFAINKIFSRIPVFRKYRKYEGRWIQYIENSDKPIAICTLRFDKEGYHFDGVNFPKNSGEVRQFKSHRFVPNTENSFYYVTNAYEDYKPQKIEGFGKVYGITKQIAGFYEAKGYFFDVSGSSSTQAHVVIHETTLIKQIVGFTNIQAQVFFILRDLRN